MANSEKHSLKAYHYIANTYLQTFNLTPLSLLSACSNIKGDIYYNCYQYTYLPVSKL